MTTTMMRLFAHLDGIILRANLAANQITRELTGTCNTPIAQLTSAYESRQSIDCLNPLARNGPSRTVWERS